jgi:hypothetical protein
MAEIGGKENLPVEMTGKPSYQRKQTGGVMTGIVLAGLASIFILMSQKGIKRVLVLYVVVLGFCALLFSSMTVTVGNGLLTVKFGLGIIRKKFMLSEIESCRVVKNPWYYGWGIRRIPGGWFFGVSGLNAVEIMMKSGKRYRIGSDVPEELEAVIREQGQHISEG